MRFMTLRMKQKHFLEKKFGSGSVNTFPAAVFFENRQFFLKIFKISKCSSSLNFKDRENLNPFLKRLKPLLSNPAAVFFENRQFFLKFFKISKCSSSLNFNDRQNLNPFLESLKPLLSVAHADREDLFSEKFSKIFHVNKVKIEDFDIYICHPQGTC